jgi:hypothetical protein
VKKQETYAVIEQLVNDKMSFKSCTNALREITSIPETSTSDTTDTQCGLTDVSSAKQNSNNIK